MVQSIYLEILNFHTYKYQQCMERCTNDFIKIISHSFEAIQFTKFRFFVDNQIFHFWLYKKIIRGVRFQKSYDAENFSYLFPCLRINILLKFFVYLLSSAFFGTTFYLSKALKRSDFSASDVWALNPKSLYISCANRYL